MRLTLHAKLAITPPYISSQKIVLITAYYMVKFRNLVEIFK